MRLSVVGFLLMMMMGHGPMLAASFSLNAGGQPAVMTRSATAYRLKYRNGDVEEYIQQRLSILVDNNNDSSSSSMDHHSHVNNRWWKGLFLGHYHHHASISSDSVALDESLQEETSQRVDEYMRFLEKRYNQIQESDTDPVVAPPSMRFRRDARTFPQEKPRRPLETYTFPSLKKQEEQQVSSTLSTDNAAASRTRAFLAAFFDCVETTQISVVHLHEPSQGITMEMHF